MGKDCLLLAEAIQLLRELSAEDLELARRAIARHIAEQAQEDLFPAGGKAGEITRDLVNNRSGLNSR